MRPGVFITADDSASDIRLSASIDVPIFVCFGGKEPLKQARFSARARKKRSLPTKPTTDCARVVAQRRAALKSASTSATNLAAARSRFDAWSFSSSGQLTRRSRSPLWSALHSPFFEFLDQTVLIKRQKTSSGWVCEKYARTPSAVYIGYGRPQECSSGGVLLVSSVRRQQGTTGVLDQNLDQTIR